MTEGRLERSDADAILPVSIGTVAWVVALIVLILAKPTLDADGTTWWIGAALVGVASGAGGLVFLRWRRSRRRPERDPSAEAGRQE